MSNPTRKSLPRIRRLRLNIIRLFNRSLFERELRFELGQLVADEKLDLALKSLAANDEKLDLALKSLAANDEKLDLALKSLAANDEKLDLALKPLATISTRMELLQIGLDAVRQSVPNSEKTDLALKSLAAISTRMDLLQLGLEAVRPEGIDQLLVRTDLLLRRSCLTPLGQDALLLTSYGALLLPSEDRALLVAASESGGVLEPGTIEVMTSLVQEGDCVLDVGANIGLTAIPLARKVGPSGEVIAFEPSSRAAGLLRQSLVLSGLSDRVTLHQNAVGGAKGLAHLNVGRILGHSSLLPLDDSTGQEEVAVETVDSIVPPGKRVRLVKIDAEGYELQVWQGMQRVVTENPEMVAIVEFGPSHLARAGVTVDTWIAAFQALSFAAYEIDEATGCLRPQRPNAELASVDSLNLLMSRQPSSAFPTLRFQ